MRIQHNIAAMNSYRNYGNNVKAVNKNLEKLSSGYKVNRAGDDAAGLAISEKMRAQIKGLEAAQKNVKDGISLVKTAEGALQEVQDMLNRMDYLATQSANGTYDNEVDRMNLNKEVTALKTEIDRIADSSNFNGIHLLDGKLGNRADLTNFAATANGIKNITISGGGKDLAGIAETLEVSNSGTDIKIHTSSSIAGLMWREVGTGNEADDNTGITSVGLTGSTTGGTVTFEAYWNDEDNTAGTTNATAAERALWEGVKVSVTLDAPDADGNYVDTAADISVGLLDEGIGLRLQIGDTADSYNQMMVVIDDMHCENLGIKDIDIGNQDDAAKAIQKIKDAINKVSSTRGDLGAIQNRLDHTSNNLSVMTENIQDAESTIRDTDVAEEMMSYTKNNILIQSAQAMLAQSNQIPQGVLQLLG